MTIQLGQSIPDVALKRLDEDGMSEVRTGPFFGRGRSILFGVPGAFTPTCSAKHLPGFIAHAEAFAAKGIGRIACVAVNDAFVMRAWGQQAQADGKVTMLADGNAELTQALGLAVDATAHGMGIRCQRFALLIEDGIVRQVNVEPPGGFRITSAEHLLTQV